MNSYPNLRSRHNTEPRIRDIVFPMTGHECPFRASPQRCSFKRRDGRIRDAQHAWPMECITCSLVIHSEPLDHLVSYESGSMHEWALGYGEGEGSRLTSDLERRYTSVASLVSGFSTVKILDVGCGMGSMVERFNKKFEAFGLEPESNARRVAISKGLQIFATIEETVKSALKFDVITLFHVIEHISEPSGIIDSLRNLLKPNGFCVIETPNSMDALLTLYECAQFQDFTYWSHHPMLHSQESLEVLFLDSDFEVIENTGIQRYPIENHLYWLSNGKPGGHDIWKGKFSADLNSIYARQLVELGISDTIWLVAKKN